MSVTALFSILKYFGPAWFKAIAEEAQRVPATIAGLAFLWVTIIGACAFAYLVYTQDAEANDVRLASMQTVVAQNTKELECAKQDRRISSKTREINTAVRLMQLAQEPTELRQLEAQLGDLQRELSNLETRYERECL